MLRVLLAASVCLARADEIIRLYPDGLPNVPAMVPKTLPSKDSVVRMTNFTDPFVKVIRPEKPNGWGVIICPGGGYAILSVNSEGDDVGAHLAKYGITSYVLRSRITDGNDPAFQYPAPLDDARRALVVAREDGAKHGVNPDRIGVMGFSAGGHLAGLLATDTPATGATQRPPAFGALIYAVASMSEPWTHSGSRNRLLGPNPAEELQRETSVEKRLDAASTPPLFLVHGQFDASVSVRNSLEIVTVATKKKIPVTLHMYPTRDHGFGLGHPDKPAAVNAWPDLFVLWLQTLPLK